MAGMRSNTGSNDSSEKPFGFLVACSFLQLNEERFGCNLHGAHLLRVSCFGYLLALVLRYLSVSNRIRTRNDVT